MCSVGRRGRGESEALTLHSVHLFKGDFEELGNHLAPSKLTPSKALRQIVRNINRRFREEANRPLDISLDEIDLE